MKCAFPRFRRQYIPDDIFFNFEQASLVPLSESNIQIIVIEKLHNARSLNQALFGFLQNNVVLPFFVVNEITTVGKNHFRIDLKTIDGQLFFTYQVKNKKIISSNCTGIPLAAKLSKTTPGSIEMKSVFSQCVQEWFKLLTDVPALGLGCMAFGTQCAAAITGNCLAKQVEAWL